jgi:pimeloyl-ACP methyl ester carboxylesterase/2'-5' RNA ligase
MHLWAAQHERLEPRVHMSEQEQQSALHAVVHYPRLAFQGLDDFRRKFDPFAGLIAEHFTLVFPIPVDLKTVREHVQSVAKQTRPFDVHISGLERTWDHWLYLQVQEGREAVLTLHDRLYSGPLRRFLRTDLPFEPHVGIGFFGRGRYDALDPEEVELDHDSYERARAEAVGLGIDAWRSVTTLDIVTPYRSQRPHERGRGVARTLGVERRVLGTTTLIALSTMARHSGMARMHGRNHLSGALSVSLLAVVACSLGQPPPSASNEREVSFHSGGVELRGTLLVPDARAPAPAIVFLHGSGPATRAGFRTYAAEFARLGIASLYFDKRGSGASGGSWLSSSLEDLVGDALAAVDYLRSVEGIDPGRVGFWGVSQAGWIAPIAAARSPDVAFMILISGGGASPRESETFSYHVEFERAGLSVEETSRATAVLDAYFDFMATGKGRTHLLEQLAEIRTTRLSPLADELEPIIPSTEVGRRNWSWIGSYDPIPDIGRVRIPVLLLFGDRDTDHPTDLAVTRWQEGLTAAGNDQVTVKVFPGAGHGIRMREGHSGSGRAPFADGYMEAQLDWLVRHVASTREPGG